MNTEFLQQMLFWTFAPKMATQFIQNKVFYGFFYGRRRVPTQGDAAYRRHFNIIYTCVVLSYLVYCLVSVERGLPLNLYNYMGVSQSSDMKELKSNYRTLSLQYHPDKVQGLTGEARARQEALYLKIRFAYDVLKDPHKRAVYDRFGEDVFTCARCQTERDYLLASLNGFLTFYSGSALLLGVLSILGKLDFGRYWRFVGLIAMAALEAGMLVGQADPLSYVFPWRTTQERVIMLRESFIVAFIAVSQIGPVLFPEKKSVRQSLLELETLTDMQLKESTVNFKSAFEPFADDPVAAGELQRKIEKMAVDLQLLENANLSAAASRAQSRKKRKSRAT